MEGVELGLEYADGRRTSSTPGLSAANRLAENDEGTQQRVNALARYSFF